MKVLVVTHPVNTNVFEVFFSETGKKYTTIDGISLDSMLKLGFVPKKTMDFDTMNPVLYRIMGKALAEKIKLLRLHIQYKDELRYLRVFQQIGEKLCAIQTKIEDDLEIPEVVTTLVNIPLPVPKNF